MIVGATSGIGEGLARRYAEEGQVKVGIMGRRAGRLKGLCRLRPEVFEAEVCDVTDLERVEASLERLAARMGGLDLLILSAGTGDLNPLLDYGVERAALETNVLGWTCVADWAVRRFERQGRGHLAAPAMFCFTRNMNCSRAIRRGNRLNSCRRAATARRSNTRLRRAHIKRRQCNIRFARLRRRGIRRGGIRRNSLCNYT